MREAGLQNVEVLQVGGSLPYAYGEWLDAPGKPTVFLYAHHDVQPVNYVEQWKSDPWKLTRRDGRLFARGSADDKGAISAFLGAIAAYRKTGNHAAGQRQDAGRGRGGGRLEEPDEVLREAQATGSSRT